MNKTKKIGIVLCLLMSIILFLTLLFLIVTKNDYVLNTDNYVAQMFFEHRTRLLDYLFVIISYMGETLTIAVLCVILLLLPSRKQIGLPVTILTVISVAINFAIKIIVARQRPESLFLTQNTLGYKMPNGYSFPSGHAQTANLFYFALSFCILNNIRKKWTRIFLIVLTSFFCLFVCLARVYLCVHFLTDVLCGLCIMITLFCTFVLIKEKYLKHLFYASE